MRAVAHLVECCRTTDLHGKGMLLMTHLWFKSLAKGWFVFCALLSWVVLFLLAAEPGIRHILRPWFSHICLIILVWIFSYPESRDWWVTMMVSCLKFTQRLFGCLPLSPVCIDCVHSVVYVSQHLVLLRSQHFSWELWRKNIHSFCRILWAHSGRAVVKVYACMRRLRLKASVVSDES